MPALATDPKAPRSFLLQVVNITLNVLRSYGVLGGTSKILAVASQGLSNLTDTQQLQDREARNAAEGVMEGGKAFTKGLFNGVMGIVTKPIRGAVKSGFSGFMEGRSPP